MEHHQRPRSIRIFLSEGHANGLTIATIPNWSGTIIIGRNADLPALLSRDEAQRPGAYILQGDHPTNENSTLAYIGQASVLKKRLERHAQEKDWWEIAALISTSDPNFAAGHFLALESRLIQIARDARRVELENVQNPSESAGQLGEADAADVESFLDDVKLVLPILGLELFRSLRLPVAKEQVDSRSSARELNSPVFFLTNRGVVLAKAMEVDGSFFVIEGSLALLNPGHATNTYALHRQKLISANVLATENDNQYLKFNNDVAFSSPSKAAAVILDRNANGRSEWKLEDGTTYNDWQRKQFDEEQIDSVR